MRRTWAWALCGVGILLALVGLGGGLVTAVGTMSGLQGVPVLLAAVALAAAGLLLYRSVVMRRWAGREPTEILASRAPDVLPGLAIGAAFILAGFAVVAFAGGYATATADDFAVGDLLAVATLVVVSAVLEELLFRGVALIALERTLGRVPALVITSAFFGASHLLNPGATLFGALAIAVEAGFFLGACFFWRRSLWFTIGIHAGWNGAESLLGIPVSGQDPHGLISVTPVGSDLLTGGDFGIEASIVPLVLGALLGAGALLLARRARVRRVAEEPVPAGRHLTDGTGGRSGGAA